MENFGNQPPKTEKNWPQELSQSQVGNDAADGETAAAAQPDICPANTKGQNQPGIKSEAQEDQVRKGRQPWPKGTQKAVQHPQQAT